MKRVPILFSLLLILILMLAACGETAGTTPAVTTTGATATTTVTTATTTVATTTAAPTPVSKNYIKEVTTMNSGSIRITLCDGTRLNLGDLPLREGYNSADIAYSFDKYTGVLTLTITESATLNIANRHLGTAKAPTVVSLRENEGMLEFSHDGGATWENLCDAKTGSAIPDSTPLLDLAEILGIGKTEAATGDSVTLVINGNSLGIRAHNWVRDGYDYLSTAVLHADTVNGNFMMSRFDEIPSSTPLSSLSVSASTLFKAASDEIPAISMNHTYIAARHGYYLISAIPNNLGLCEEDIGAIFTRQSDGQRYVLVKIPSGMLWLCPFDDEAMKTGNFGKYSFGTTGLLKKGDVLKTEDQLSVPLSSLTVADDAVLNQFYVSTNHAKQAILLNGTEEVDTAKDGIYQAEFVDIYEEYDVIYLPAMLEHLMENFGFNTNDSQHDEEISAAYLTYAHTHRYHKNGSYTVYQTVTVRSDLKNVHYYGVMSMAFPGDSHYVYAPGSTNVGTPTLQENTTVEALGDWHIRSYYQLTDPIGTKGMNVGYYPYFGVATDENREDALGNKAGYSAGQWYQSRKMYPYLFMNQDMKAGETIDFIGYHVPTIALDEDFFAVNWYFVGDEIYLSLHTDHAVDRQFVALPNSDYLCGRILSIDESSESFTVHSATVTAEGIEVSTSGAGYVTLKLTPAE
ncbi:MAG: hypothetical protein J6T24_05240 [Clostridia bacterium]|nr:hypothetical protein [Clostridia bacterium]